jgi:hypothetical protein
MWSSRAPMHSRYSIRDAELNAMSDDESRNTEPYPSTRTTCRLDLPKQIGPSTLPWLRHITWPST